MRLFEISAESLLGLALLAYEWGTRPSNQMSTAFVLLSGFLFGIAAIRFFQWERSLLDRGELPSFFKELRSSREVWALWRSGIHFHASEEHKLSQWKRVILHDPCGEFINIMAIDDKNSPAQLKRDVRRTIIKFKIDNPECELRLFSGVISEGMVISDPKRWNGWIRLESGLPIPGGIERSQRYIYKLLDRKLFNVLVRYYEQVWDDGQRTRVPSHN